MIGFTHTAGRDMHEAILNGVVDEDLDAIAEAIAFRKDAQKYAQCDCGEKFLKPDVICIHDEGTDKATAHMSVKTFDKHWNA